MPAPPEPRSRVVSGAANGNPVFTVGIYDYPLPFALPRKGLVLRPHAPVRIAVYNLASDKTLDSQRMVAVFGGFQLLNDHG